MMSFERVVVLLVLFVARKMGVVEQKLTPILSVIQQTPFHFSSLSPKDFPPQEHIRQCVSGGMPCGNSFLKEQKINKIYLNNILTTSEVHRSHGCLPF